MNEEEFTRIVENVMEKLGESEKKLFITVSSMVAIFGECNIRVYKNETGEIKIDFKEGPG